MPDVRRNLGHRLALTQGTYPSTAGGTVSLQVTVRNTGWAAPVNPRSPTLVLRHTARGAVHLRPLDADPRRWAPGASATVNQTVSLAGVPAGDYRLLLSLPDPQPRLTTRPEYAIRLANTCDRLQRPPAHRHRRLSHPPAQAPSEPSASPLRFPARR